MVPLPGSSRSDNTDQAARSLQGLCPPWPSVFVDLMPGMTDLQACGALNNEMGEGPPDAMLRGGRNIPRR
jgi:hypothetical protein